MYWTMAINITLPLQNYIEPTTHRCVYQQSEVYPQVERMWLLLKIDR